MFAYPTSHPDTLNRPRESTANDAIDRSSTRPDRLATYAVLVSGIGEETRMSRASNDGRIACATDTPGPGTAITGLKLVAPGTEKRQVRSTCAPKASGFDFAPQEIAPKIPTAPLTI